MPRFSFRPALFAIILIAAASCRGEGAERAGPILDDFGAAIDTAAPPAVRIVSLNPATTELLFAIGAGEALIGRSDWDHWPEAARDVPPLGPALRPNVEAVLATRPDLVMLYASEDNRAAADRLRAAGVPVLALKIDRIEHIDRALRLFGAVTGRSARADTVARTLTATLDSVRVATAGLPRPRVFWHIWSQPLITIGAGSFLHELLDIAGAENVYADLPAVSPPVSLEDVVRRDPDVILAGPLNAAVIVGDPRWKALRAVREGRIAVVDTMLVARPSIMLGAAAAHLAGLLHPELAR
jgi:ABC-type Fe3+-hydroxamate transport system substrate-binding protein